MTVIIRIRRYGTGRWYWQIELQTPNSKRTRAKLENDWSYASEYSATAAARRLARDLGLHVTDIFIHDVTTEGTP